MTHPLHSDYCHCECPILAKTLDEIIAAMKSNIGTIADWVALLEYAVDHHER